MRISPPPSILLVLAFALVVAACTDDPAEPATTAATTTTIGIDVQTEVESAVTVGEGVDGAEADALVAELDELRTTTEVLRGLGFLSAPQIVVLTADDFSQRRDAYLDASLDAPSLARDTEFLQTFGLLQPSEDLRATLVRASSAPVNAYYDEAAGELVVAASGELDAVGQSVVVREFVRVLTDQYHRYGARVGEYGTSGFGDEATALETLATSDALYFQLLYLEDRPSADQAAAAGVDAFGDAPAPAFLASELAFAGDVGLGFVAWLLQDGGIAALDAAYGAERLTTEHLYHPARFAAGEGVLEIPEPVAEVEGYGVHDAGTMGELGLRSLLSAALSPGMLTQTADGWGADRFVMLADLDDVALVYTYRGDSIDDTVEVAQAFLDHAAFVMQMAEPRAVAGGIEYVGLADAPPPAEGAAPPGPYVFVDRSGDGLVVIVSEDPATGAELRNQVSAP